MIASWLTFALLCGTFCAGRCLAACLPPARVYGRLSKCRIEWAVQLFAATLQNRAEYQRGCKLGGQPRRCNLLHFLYCYYFFLFCFSPLHTPPSPFLPARRTSLPVLLFVPFRQPVGINGNVNTARYRGNFTKMGIYFWAGAAGVGRGGCRGLGGVGEKLGAAGGRPGGRSEMVRSRSGSGHACALAPAGLRLCNPGGWTGEHPLRSRG